MENLPGRGLSQRGQRGLQDGSRLVTSFNPFVGADWEGSAREYDAFERKWGHYGRVAEKLVAPLGVRPDSRVLELASGSGACTKVLLRLCPRGAVVCVERSAAMVALAKGNLGGMGGNLVLVHGDAADVSQLVRGYERFDFAVCNGAFWQFREPERVAESVIDRLVPGGVFAFNIPSLVGFTAQRRAYRATVDAILERRGLDNREFWKVRRRRDFAGVLEEAGFEVTRNARYSVPMYPGLEGDWRRIPVFERRWGNFRGLPEEVSSEILAAAAKVPVKLRERRSWWRLFVGRKPNRVASPSVK